jgi:thiol-disulfide isomerase/thioredoxin
MVKIALSIVSLIVLLYSARLAEGDLSAEIGHFYTEAAPEKLEGKTVQQQAVFFKQIASKYGASDDTQLKVWKVLLEKYGEVAFRLGAPKKWVEVLAGSTAGTHYETLGVLPSSRAKDIKAAFRKLSRKYHPDKPSGDATMFDKVADAYEILSDATERSRYDRSQGIGPKDSDWWSEDPRIQNLDQSSFQAFISKGPVIFVHYSSDNTKWQCENTGFGQETKCDLLVSEIPRLAHLLEQAFAEEEEQQKQLQPVLREHISSLPPRVRVGAIDCAKHSTVCRHGKVAKLPTIKYLDFTYSNSADATRAWPPGAINFDFDIDDKQQPLDADSILEWVQPFRHLDLLHRLTPENFENEVLQSELMWLVVFNAGTWCPPCVRIYPHLARAAWATRGVAKVGFINCDDASVPAVKGRRGLVDDGSAALCKGELSDFVAKGYPTIVAYPRGAVGKNEGKQLVGKGKAAMAVGNGKGQFGWNPGVSVELWSEVARLAYPAAVSFCGRGAGGSGGGHAMNGDGDGQLRQALQGFLAAAHADENGAAGAVRFGEQADALLSAYRFVGDEGQLIREMGLLYPDVDGSVHFGNICDATDSDRQRDRNTASLHTEF